ncbi:3-phosphoshikimate 1-carboxyvinyltransferase [Pilimelia columellifera]|uniref:3-phosphoshikimate 1-carboxyvinyltransferase n=1 Tax=Pilimelia columellifera subsp. columellifera TaxID=706583 RepID=A0ABN3N7J5_9ACTN
MSSPAPIPTAQPWAAPTAHGPVDAALDLPGSKSMTARALILSALSGEQSTIAAPLLARDTELMADGLRALGCAVSTMDDQRWVVRPGPLHGPAKIDVGLAGTVMRFLPVVAGLADGATVFDGDPAARVRPLGPLVAALRDLGVPVEAHGVGRLPLTVTGAGRIDGGPVTIDASASSQFISALLLAAPRFDNGLVIRHEGPPVPSAPHLRMTAEMLRAAGAGVDDSVPDLWAVEPGRLSGRSWVIEPDLSGAAPFLAAALVTGGVVRLPGWPPHSAQPVTEVRDLIARLGGTLVVGPDGITVTGGGTVTGIDVDLSGLSELTPMVAALAVLADRPSQLRGIGHIRGHETDRISALARELTALGAGVDATDDGLVIRPRRLRASTVHTYDDHRMAHAAAIIGLAVPGVRLTDVACTAKTMPQFATLWSGMVNSAEDRR